MENRTSLPLAWVYPVLLISGLACLGWGIGLMIRGREHQILLVMGSMMVVISALAWCMAAGIHDGQQRILEQQQEMLAAVREHTRGVTALLSQISQQQLISERAKAIAFRENEKDALRRAIREEAEKKDWEAALALVSQMEMVFGYRQEAARIRDEITSQREAAVQQQLAEGMAAIDRHCRGEQWSLALREAERLMGAFPDHPQLSSLPREIEGRRQALKKQLLDAWNDAVSRHDVDGSIEILRHLDLYLTPAEAQAMQDTARQVFKDKLQSLGQQFAMAVKNHAWAEAIRLGETIISEFPNSRMAQEVRERMDLLRQKASEPASTRTA